MYILILPTLNPGFLQQNDSNLKPITFFGTWSVQIMKWNLCGHTYDTNWLRMMHLQMSMPIVL